MDEFRQCEYCGCNTNAKQRACCNAGREVDRLAAEVELLTGTVIPDLKLDCEGLKYVIEENQKLRGALREIEDNDHATTTIKAIARRALE